MFNSDPSTLRHIPMSEYRKRRLYYELWRKEMGQATTDEHGVTVEHYGATIEEDATILES